MSPRSPTSCNARAGCPGRQPALDRLRIATAAASLVDAEGLEALTMRRLGAELGVAAMSLYRHVANRDDVLAAVIDLHFGKAVQALVPASTWPDTLAGFGRAYRRTLLAHPKAVPLLAVSPVSPEAGAEGLAPILDQFRRAGVAEEDALFAVQSVAVLVLGHVLAQVGTVTGGTDPQGGDNAPDTDAGAEEWFDRWFDLALGAIVTGLGSRLGASRTS